MTSALDLPDVSVIMPAWNAEDTIGSAIESILAQATDARIEIIVIDDRSNDRTPEIARSFTDRALALGHRVRVLPNSRSKGPSGARNTGLLTATGQFLAFLDADDQWFSNHIHLGTSVLKTHQRIGAVFFDVEIHDGRTDRAPRHWYHGKRQMAQMRTEPLDDSARCIVSDVIDHLIEESFIRLQSLVIRRDKVESVLFREDIDRSEDRDFVIQMLHRQPMALACSDLVTGLYFRRAGSLTAEDRPDVGLALVRAHITLFKEYLGWADLDEQRRSRLRRKLQAAKIECSYHLRHQGAYRCALIQLYRSSRFGLKSRQFSELLKTLLSMTLPTAFTQWVSTVFRRSKICLRA